MACLSFGIISDIQFAFVKDRTNLPGKKNRHYLNSRKLLKEAVSHWNNEDNSFVIQLGDIIDGVNESSNTSHLSLNAVLQEFDKVEVDVKHVLGNHELYNFSRSELLKTPLLPSVFQGLECHASKATRKHRTKQDLSSPFDAFYFTFVVEGYPEYRFIVLDTFDLSVLGRSATSIEYNNAYNILRKHNLNEDLSLVTGLEGIARRYTKDNGGIGKVQMEWLDKVLSHADVCDQRVVLFSHIPLHPKCCKDDIDIIWNYDEVLDLLWSHPCVKVSLSGHLHENCYYRDKNGIHHRSITAVVEADKQSNAYATIHLTKQRMKIEGHGEVDSQTFDF